MTADGTRVLVTGAGGFVMSVFIADLLARDPTAHVAALDAAPLDAAAKAHFARFGDRITFLRCDVRDREALQLEIGKVPPTILVNAATVTHVPAWEYERPHVFIDVNIGGSLNVLEAARAAGSLGRVVHVSSCAVYGHGDTDAAPVLQGEAGPFHPADLYGVGKLGGELVARRFSELHGVPTAVVRFTRVFGPMERPTGARKLMHLPYLMMKKMLAGRPLRITRRSADAVGDWISSEDVSDAIVKLCGSRSANRAYNIATGQPIRTTEVLAQAPVEVEWVDDGAEADADFDPMLKRGQHAAYDIAAIGRDVGWRPRPLAQQMATYLAWARQNPRTFEGA
ncbi:MAG TPA: NAD(P)-dependent oxidoreductase [Roseiarcus sp.]|jgi:nucleoside-diphosphate-sugar epimerase